jgi:hypothetical protein
MPGAGITAKEQSVRIAGAIVRLSEKAFESLLTSEPVDLVISSPRYLIRTSVAGRGAMRRGWQYLAVSRGVVFHTITKSQASLPSTVKLVEAEDIWVSFLGPKTPSNSSCT